MFVFYSRTPAKKLIKANLDKYKSSCIIKYEQMGIGKNLGEIDIKKDQIKTFSIMIKSLKNLRISVNHNIF